MNYMHAYFTHTLQRTPTPKPRTPLLFHDDQAFII